MTRFRLLLLPLILGLTLSALMLLLLRSPAAEARTEIWGDPHVQEWGVVADLTGSMSPELNAFLNAWNRFQPPMPEADAYRLAAFRQQGSYLGQATSAAEFSQLLAQLESGEEGPCPPAALDGLVQLVGNSEESVMKGSQTLLLTDGTPKARPQQIAYMVELMLRRGIRLNTILSGWCDGAPLPKPAMAFLAESTGGKLVRPKAPGDYVSDTLVTMSLMEKRDVILSRVVDLGDGGSSSLEIPLGAGGISLGVETEDKDGSDGDDDDDWVYRCLTCIIPSPYILPMMVPETSDLQAQLKDPDGNVIGPGSPGFDQIVTAGRHYLDVQTPGGSTLNAGLWQLQINGTGLRQVTIKANSGVHLAYLGPSWSHAAGQMTPIRAGLLADDPNWRPAVVSFSLTSLTGDTVIPLTLHDDGQHGDGAAEDGLYGGIYTPTIRGFFYLQAVGESENGAPFQRQDPAPIRVQRYRLSNPSPRTVAPNSSQRMTFTLTNENQPPDSLPAQIAAEGTIFDLALFSSHGWAITDTVPATVTVDYGASVEIGVDLEVPTGAQHGAVEETTLVALQAGDLAGSRSATAISRLRYPNNLYLPFLQR